MNIVSSSTKIHTRAISDQLYDILREKILSGALRGGEPVRQDVIASLFDVSKIPVREALARLQQDGFVSVHPKRGFSVTQLSADEAEDVFHLRLRIEPEATALGAAHATEADALHAREMFVELEEAIARKDIQRGVYNGRFHMALIRPGAGPTTMRVLDLLNVAADRYVRFHLHMNNNDTRANLQHKTLLECWLEGNKRKIEKLTREHIQMTLDDLRQALGT